MSKAFTREDDDRPEARLPRRTESQLPPGTPNYLTVEGELRFRNELSRLVEESTTELPNDSSPPASTPNSPERADRIRELRSILRSATIIRPRSAAPDRIRFGTTVRVKTSRGEELQYQIVGVDEADPNQGKVNWLAPIAKALMGARVGDLVRFHSPAGDEELQIVAISC